MKWEIGQYNCDGYIMEMALLPTHNDDQQGPPNDYRSLRKVEIEQMMSQGCESTDWSAIRVREGFCPERIRHCSFSGEVKIGLQNQSVYFPGEVEEPTGISHARIHNCVVGDNVYISNVENYIANYIIEDEVVIRHVDLLVVDGESTFGNGSEARVINESGGREVPIYDYLTAHIAYLIGLYRHRPVLISELQRMIDSYVNQVRSNMGHIGRSARLIDCGRLINVKLGEYAVLEGVGRLENGTVNSCAEDPAVLGTGVIAENFIISTGAEIRDQVILKNCFVGQGTSLGRQYSAEHSVFFANCAGYHGEACSVFAGPFTVTHHKSTLLIAGMYSFLNAGSGSNQSNHMYKLGPVHQGVVERGSKTTSDSYLLWPARVGPFTLVMGRHYGNFDTSNLPYSYLIEHEDESVLVPGVNLRSLGTVRDARKWPRRDKRRGPVKLDLISYNLLTPYTVQKMFNGIDILMELKNRSGENTPFYYYNSVKIKRSSLENGIRFYRLGIERYLGNCLVKQLLKLRMDSLQSLREGLRRETAVGEGDWIDQAGLVMPRQCLEEIIADVESGRLTEMRQLNERFYDSYAKFEQYEWAWAYNKIESYYDVRFEMVSAAELTGLLENWIAVVEKLDQMRLDDAQKEFGAWSRTGFGINGSGDDRDRDFAAVRGNAANNAFILELKNHLERKQETARELIARLQSLSS